MSAIDVAATLWLRRFGGRAVPDDVDHLTALLLDEAPDDANVILDAVRAASLSAFVSAVVSGAQ